MQVIFMKDYTAKTYLITGFIFTAILGTLAHFFYEWCGENPLVGLFSPVNESTWEHMKLLFFPVVLWSLFIPDGLAEQKPGLRPALLLGGITGTLLIPVLFYTYSGILGRTVTGIDISIFFISVTIAFLCAYHITDAESVQKNPFYLFPAGHRTFRRSITFCENQTTVHSQSAEYV